MIKSRLKTGLLFVIISLIICPLGSGCAPDQDFDKQLRAITKPHIFSIVEWEFGAFGEGIRKTLFNGQKYTDNSSQKILQYFHKVEQIKILESKINSIKAGNRRGDSASLENELNELKQQNVIAAETIEQIIEVQVREAYSEEEIYNPINKYTGYQFSFPPVNIKLAKMPHLLVVSPRDKIESMREVTLLPDLSLEDMESIESDVDDLGVSSLVAALGGIATYPSLVIDTGSLRFTLDTVAEEWLHHYLAFTPLGFRYTLDTAGIIRNYEIATMNETLVGIVSKEIGANIYEEYFTQNEVVDTEPETGVLTFDFNQEMREIRRDVDDFLDRGKIEQAEEFMEQKRQYLATKGYHIRKLNQAYFAFHGTYADRPTSISPIGADMKKLRSQSTSLKEFLDKAASFTSRQDLTDSLN
ncbi:hypothetical protein ACFLWU_00750 [Chloroflexota bacterium]